jgi:arylsulfatase A-like enzyme
MADRKLIFVNVRIYFVFFSVLFMTVAIYFWDGYSYYMKLNDFLPDLSLSFVVWTLYGTLLTCGLQLIAGGFLKIIPLPLKGIRLEHVSIWFISAVAVIFAQEYFPTVDDGLDNFMVFMIMAVPVVILSATGRGKIEKILYSIDNRVKPLSWMFLLLLLISLPFSVLAAFREEPVSMPYGNENNASDNLNRPNIILVTMDSLTARDMQVYGYEFPTTPFLKKWAEDAILFERAYSPTNWTTPSVMSMLTGQRVWTHRVWYQAFKSPVQHYGNNLLNVLRNNGYRIFGFVQNSCASPNVLGLAEYFMNNDSANSFRRLPPNYLVKEIVRFFMDRPVVNDLISRHPVDIKHYAKGLLQILGRNSNSEDERDKLIDFESNTLTPPEMVYDRFFDVLFSSDSDHLNGKAPLFAWIHTFPPHNPYLPPRAYRYRFGDSENVSLSMHSEYRSEDQQKVNILRKRYNEFIMYSDEQFRVFMEKLSKKIDMSNTIVIFSSDHGENFSHGYLGHLGDHLYEPLVHVPLIIKIPGSGKGTVLNVPVELTDVPPTVLELADLSVPEWMEGRSLLPLIEGHTMESRPVFSMQLISNSSFEDSIKKGTIAVWKDDYKLIHYLEENKSLLFNVMKDPDEQLNLVKEEPDVGDDLLGLIRNYLDSVNGKRAGLDGKEIYTVSSVIKENNQVK